MSRRLLAGLAAVVAVALLYQFALRTKHVAPRLVPTVAIAAIGSGSSAVGVSAEGAVLSRLSPKHPSLPLLALSKPPPSGHLAGTTLAQVRVLAAAPARLRPYLKSSRYGQAGVDVELSTGVELRFGGPGETARKWRAAAAVLADPAVTALDYVNLSVPGRPGIRGSGHPLPPVP